MKTGKAMLDEILEATGWTLGRLAQETGISISTLYPIQIGRVEPRSLTYREIERQWRKYKRKDAAVAK